MIYMPDSTPSFTHLSPTIQLAHPFRDTSLTNGTPLRPFPSASPTVAECIAQTRLLKTNPADTSHTREPISLHTTTANWAIQRTFISS